MNQCESAPLRLLIVEDDPMMRLGLKHSLQSQTDVEIVGAVGDGHAGVEAAIALHPHVVIMDVGLPHLDGIAATQEIKAALPPTRVIILTSHTCKTEVIAALSSGAEAYCIKGTHLEQLTRAIATVMDGAIYLDAQIAQQVVNCLKPPKAKRQQVPVSAEYLSERELEVLQLIVEGYSNPEIASYLHLSTNTIKAYVKSVMNKLAVDDRVQAAVIALRNGIVD